MTKKKIKAYIVYGGSPEWYNATLIFENGWAAFGHLCSHPYYMYEDLWGRRQERQAILEKMGYEVEIVGDPIAGSDNAPASLLLNNQNEVNYKYMSEAYERVKADLYPDKSV